MPGTGSDNRPSAGDPRPSHPNILIIAGEASGDRHAARLVAAIRRKRPDAAFWGIGGGLLRAAGVETIVDAAEMNVVGFVEVVKRYRFFRGVFNRIVSLVHQRRPSFAILVDYPGFNLRLAEALHAEGVRVIYYIAPQVWAWKEGRVKKLRKYVDDLIVAFPFEVEYFRRHRIEPHFFGHPLVDQVDELVRGGKPQRDNGDIPVIAYLPGSRPEEIERHMPVLCDVMIDLGESYRHVIPLATTIPWELLDRFRARVPFEIVGSAFEALAGANAALVKSGTSTIDATLLDVPFAVFYRTSALSYQIARRLISVPYIAMTNVLAGRAVVREFVQDDLRADLLARELRSLIADADHRNEVLAGLAHVRELLGAPGATERVSEFILDKYLAGN
jgi:lipid-A-disaccharide synthase